MNKAIIQRKFEGVIVSDKMDKTVVVQVSTVKTHPKYKKRYRASKKYKAHDETNAYKIGDKVLIVACRPISKDKRWLVVKKLEVKNKAINTENIK